MMPPSEYRMDPNGISLWTWTKYKSESLPNDVSSHLCQKSLRMRTTNSRTLSSHWLFIRQKNICHKTHRPNAAVNWNIGFSVSTHLRGEHSKVIKRWLIKHSLQSIHFVYYSVSHRFPRSNAYEGVPLMFSFPSLYSPSAKDLRMFFFCWDITEVHRSRPGRMEWSRTVAPGLARLAPAHRYL